jgi:origin recognition complex subunit 1
VDNITGKCWVFAQAEYDDKVRELGEKLGSAFIKEDCYWYTKSYLPDAGEFRPSHQIWTYDVAKDEFTDWKNLSRSFKRKHEYFDASNKPQDGWAPVPEGVDEDEAEEEEEEDPNFVMMSQRPAAKAQKKRRHERDSRREQKELGSAPAKDRDVFAEASAKLSLNAVPDQLPCREKEHKRIHDYLYNIIRRGGLSGGLYISGMPGTGKTATCRQVVRGLEELARQEELPEFQFVEINALKLARPSDAYSVLYEELTGEQVSSAQACKKLDTLFSRADSARDVCVVLLDELDYLVTSKQDVLYNFFDWPCRRNARLCVIGIANTMDLPERLTLRVQSRLGDTRLQFQPYSKDDVKKIIRARLEGIEIFKDDAIELCARKVSKVSGDIRKALAVCRRAAERFQAEQTEGSEVHITAKHVATASEELTSSKEVQLLQALNLYEKLFLVCLNNLRTRGAVRSTTGDVLVL